MPHPGDALWIQLRQLSRARKHFNCRRADDASPLPDEDADGTHLQQLSNRLRHLLGSCRYVGRHQRTEIHARRSWPVLVGLRRYSRDLFSVSSRILPPPFYMQRRRRIAERLRRCVMRQCGIAILCRNRLLDCSHLSRWRHSGAVSGVMNTAGILGGIASTLLVPILVKHFGWLAALGSGAVMAILCTVLWWILGREALLTSESAPLPRCGEI